MLKEMNIIEKVIDGKNLFAMFMNEDNRFCIFAGSEGYDALVKEPDINTQYFNYSSDEPFSLNDKDNNTSTEYTGELIIFKKKIPEEVFKNIFRDIAEGIKEGNWSNLKSALNDISEILDIENDEQMSETVAGYIGEISFMYWLMKNSDDGEFNKKVFDAYQQKEGKKHDFSIKGKNKNVDLEIKSTKGESKTFTMKSGQQEFNMNNELFYGFVKYDFAGGASSISVKKMLEMVFETFDVPNTKRGMPNHLIINSSRYDFDKIMINADGIEVYIINNNKLPDFYKDEKNNGISDIKYKLNLPEFISTKDELKEYGPIDGLNELKTAIEEI